MRFLWRELFDIDFASIEDLSSIVVGFIKVACQIDRIQTKPHLAIYRQWHANGAWRNSRNNIGQVVGFDRVWYVFDSNGNSIRWRSFF